MRCKTTFSGSTRTRLTRAVNGMGAVMEDPPQRATPQPTPQRRRSTTRRSRSRRQTADEVGKLRSGQTLIGFVAPRTADTRSAR